MGDAKDKSISSDELWAKAAQPGPITRSELGIRSSTSSNSDKSLNAGTEKWTFGLKKEVKADDHN